LNNTNSRLEKLEKLVESLSQKLENFGRKIGDSVENSFTDVSKRKADSRRKNQFWGWALLICGLLFLNRSMGWFALDFPLWAIICILAGVYLIIKSRQQKLEYLGIIAGRDSYATGFPTFWE